MSRSVVLVGAGHGHMEVLRRAAWFAHAGIRLTLIDPGRFWYSGAATGALSGALRREAASLNLPAPEGVTVVGGRAVSIDPDARTVTLEDGCQLGFDVASLNTGSRIDAPRLLAAGATPVKPMARLFELQDALKAAGGRGRIVVAGAGATGVEVALALAALQRRLGARVQVVLAGPDLLPGWPDRARVLAQRALTGAGVEYCPTKVRDWAQGVVFGDDGFRAPAEHLIVATGLRANLPDGLPTGADGLPVGADMAWVDHPNIFAIGDCAHLVANPRPKLGVFGVRAAPVLVENLIRAATGRTPRRAYHPQRRWLSVMDLGDGTGLGRYDGWAFRGRGALRLKRWLDRRFVDRYRTL